MNELTDIFSASSPLLIVIFMTTLGKVLNMSPWFPNKYIQITLCVVGAVGYVLLEGFSGKNAILGFTIGGLAAVGANKIYRDLIGYKTPTDSPPTSPA